MDDSALMSVMHGDAYFDHELEALTNPEAARLCKFEQGCTTYELHRKIWLRPESAVRSAGFVNLRDAWMLERAKRLRFLLEPAEGLRAGETALNYLEGD